jgi:adenylate kinase family enzyme
MMLITGELRERGSDRSVLVLGVPGAGKTSLAARLAAELNATHFAASEVLRRYVVDHPDRSAELTAYWAMSKNAPDRLVNPILWDAYRRCRRPTLLDGYPRTVGQVVHFIAGGAQIGLVVVLEITAAGAIERARRRTGHRAIETAADLLAERIRREAAEISRIAAMPELAARVLRVDAERNNIDAVAARVIKSGHREQRWLTAPGASLSEE